VALDERTHEHEPDPEHQVTPLELFFDLVFVFAVTQVTGLLADDPTWGGVLRGMLVLAALWWAWTAYAWLTSTMDVDEGGVRLAMLAAMGAMLVVALAVPGAFGDDPVLFGESIIAIGVGAGFKLVAGVIVAAALGIVVVSALWWLYFDVAAIFARRRLMQATGIDQARLARDAYSYLHLPMVAGIVLFALGLKATLGHIGEALDTVTAVGLCGGTALYLLGHVAFLFRATGRVFRRRTIGAVLLLALVPAALAIPALAALALVSAVCSLVVAYEAIRHREHRVHVRHPELAA
jgi:low temperature requirement protein LtrA